MAKKARNKLKVVLVVFAAYWLAICAVAFIATVLSLTFALNSRFTLSKISSIVARGALMPFTYISKKTDSTFFLAWEKGLFILEESPSLATHLRKLQTTYTDHTPLDPQLITSIQKEYSHFLYELAVFQQLVSRSSLMSGVLSLTPYKSAKEQLNQNAQLLQASDAFLHFISDRLEQNQPVRLIILFQNNMELRATGGFPGSYATLTLANNAPIEFEVQDIYVPDGQLEGHVDPPLPIQEAFQQGFWKLRDANWHPDFQESANRVEWFFTEANYPPNDGVIGLNFTVTQKLLGITGPIHVSDLNTTVTQENIYPILQRANDTEFFAGSTKKKDTIDAFMTQLIFKLQHLSPPQYLQLFSLIDEQLQQKNILISVKDANLASFATLNHWDGKLNQVSCDQYGCSQDYFSLFEANLGVNKSNCCVNRQVTLEKESDQNNLMTTTTTLNYQNLGPGTEYTRVAGDYKAFIRLYYPANTQITPPIIEGKSYTEYIREMKALGYLHPITSEGYSWGEMNGLKELGMWVVVPKEKELNLSVKAISIISPYQPYSLIVQKQPGTLEQFNKYSISLDGKMLFNDEIQKDLVLK